MALSESAATVLLVVGIGVVAGALALWQRYERRQRDPDLSGDEARHYMRQDLRRSVAGVVLLLLAMGIAVGSRLEHRPAGRANPYFMVVWLAVFGLLMVLIWLAILDGIATWLYARRQRRALARERIQILRDRHPQRPHSGNGHGNGRSTPGGPFDGDSASGA